MLLQTGKTIPLVAIAELFGYFVVYLVLNEHFLLDMHIWINRQPSCH